jgi:hypothetical protein
MEMVEINRVNLNDCDSTTTASNSEIDFDIAENSQVSQPQNEPAPIALPPPTVSTNINSLSLESSSGVHFGNQVFYNGPVNYESKANHSEESEKFGFAYLMSHKAMLTLAACSFLLFALLILVLAIKFDNSIDESTVSYPNQLKIIKRNEWMAEAPAAVPELLDPPVDVILVDCTGKFECYSEVKIEFK